MSLEQPATEGLATKPAVLEPKAAAKQVQEAVYWHFLRARSVEA